MPDYGNKVLKLVLDSKLPDYIYIREQGKEHMEKKDKCEMHTAAGMKLDSCFK